MFQVGELAGSAADSANKVLTGVVDSSWTALRGLISAPAAAASTEDGGETVPPPGENRPNMRPRQASSFSLASVTASVATIAAAAANRSRSRANSRASAMVSNPPKEEHKWKGNEEMVEVTSRPGSIREPGTTPAEYPSSDESNGSDTEDEDARADEAGGLKVKSAGRNEKDASSTPLISRSEESDKDKEKDDGRERVSIGDRLASIGVLGRLSSPSETSLPNEQPQGKAVG